MLRSVYASAAASRIPKPPMGMPPFPSYRFCTFSEPDGIVELGLLRAHEYRLVRDFAVVNFRTRQLQALGLNSRRRIFHQKHGLAVLQ